MKIGIFTDYYAPSTGGTETAIANYKHELEALGHKVYVFTPSYGEQDKTVQDKNIIRLRTLPFLKISGAPLLLLYPGMIRKLATYNLDVIHSMTPFSSNLIAAGLSRRCKVAHVTTLHTLISEQVDVMPSSKLIAALVAGYGLFLSTITGNYRWWQSFFSRKYRRTGLMWRYLLSMLELADTTTVASPQLEQKLRHHNFTKTVALLPMFSTIPDGSNMHDESIDSLLRGTDRVLRVVAIGRLAPEKRIDVLIKAMHQIDARLRWHLFVAGEGPERSRLEKLIGRLHLSERVSLCGNLNQNQLAQLLTACDVFALVSYRFDTQGIVILDAARNGLPIIYCDDRLKVGLTPDNSLLCDKSAEGIAAAVNELAHNDKRRQQMGAASRRVAEELSPPKLAQQLIAIYQNVIDKSVA